MLTAAVVLSLIYLAQTREVLRETLLDHIISGFVVVAVAALIFVNRAGHFRFAAASLVIVSVLGIFGTSLPTIAKNGLLVLNYLAIPMVLSGLLLRLRFTVFVSLLSVAGVLLFMLLGNGYGQEVPLSSTSLIAAFVIVAAYQRNQLEADRRAVLEQNEERLAHLATHDALTGLPNRLLFSEHLSTAIRRRRNTARGFAVLYMDVDEFKAVNDGLGHAAGDELLVAIGERLRESLRESDIVSRHGGDEFCVMVDDLETPESAQFVIRKIEEEFRAPFLCAGSEVFVTVSTGVSYYPDDGTDPYELIRKADTALYEAKERGKDTYTFYSAEMSERSALRMQLSGLLRDAIASGEIRTVYHPQVEPATGEVTGVEVLARWDAPGHGPVAPNFFFSLAAETGLVVELTNAVIDRAVSELGPVVAEHASRDIIIAINVTERDLRDPALYERINALISDPLFSNATLEIELTENIFFRDSSRDAKLFRGLQGMGVRVALDDFGAGFATLQQISSVPIDTLKLDRAISHRVNEIAGQEAIIAGVREITSRLGMKIIAEGVETNEELRTVYALGCEIVQGWVYCTALTAEELATALVDGYAPLKRGKRAAG